ncbi:hypothetical protein [Sphingobium boeckii]|uniref:Uncharacterized protein n=1 Tax=Sphingobium boeckii TaxID=1082345 RepID=A0A7W9EEJ3_9SPHN|nr:hypothetical protein [Sphingobium boeckii]MBB5686104.1 hypothetical protein [Sphingobium boeckii]
MAAVLTDDQDRWKRRISNNAAAALLVFTLLHILCFVAVSGYTGWRWINLLGIAILVGFAIPAISKIEARWEALTREPLGPAEISTHFRRERMRLWIAAILLPFLGSAVFLGAHALAG